MNKLLIGKLGETYAEKFLNANNYQILRKNFHSRFGEIDIIALDLNASHPQVVFLEVKTRTNDSFGAPQESISRQKLSRIFKTAMHFTNFPTKNNFRHWRIDAIAVKLNYNHKLETIDHFKNISHGCG